MPIFITHALDSLLPTLYSIDMYIQENVPLQAFSTMRLGGSAAYLSEVNEHQDIASLVAWAKKRQLPIIMIGDGSNIVWRDEGFEGLVLVNKLSGFEIKKIDDNTAYFTVGAGENWDRVVERVVQLGFNGISELSLIPGTMGATPIQNVGAYGSEISDTLVTIEAYDLQADKYITMKASECEFGYRTSRFKTVDKNRFLIVSVTLLLSKSKPLPPFYSSVQHFFDKNDIISPSPLDVRNAVVAIRTQKLPDVKIVANNGSFFANPVIDQDKFLQLLDNFEHIKYWRTDGNKVKISAAWLIEQAGFKDFHDEETGMATWPNQALVMVNEKAKNTSDLLKFKQKIVNTVESKFNLTLIQEPELLP